MKIGVLYPRSKAHAGMMPDFMDGLKTALQLHQLSPGVQLTSESIGFGGQDKEVYEKAEKLLLLESVDLLVAYVDLRVLELLKPLLFSSGKLVIIVNPGANYPDNWVPQPNIVQLTLQHGFSCWLTGKIAAQQNKINAAMVTTFYDCGYLHTAAMVKSFMKEGGKITYNHVNNQLYDDTFDIKPLTDHLISDATTNCLLCVFDSLPASLFYSRLNNYDGAAGLHLFVSPMMLEEQALGGMKDGFNFPIDGYLSWHASLENSANKDFIDNYLEQTKRTASAFSLLGWETALILKELFLNDERQFSDGAAMVAKLSMGTINSPRGKMKLDIETNFFVAPVYKCSLLQHSSELLLEKEELSEQGWVEFTADPFQGASSGWTNTYLCY